MKRFVSLILSVCFLFSINTVSYAANISSRKASNPVIQSMNDKYHVDFSGMSIDELNKFIDKMKDEDQTRASGNLLNNTQLAWLAAAQIARDKGYECAALMVEFSVYNIDYSESVTDSSTPLLDKLNTTTVFNNYKNKVLNSGLKDFSGGSWSFYDYLEKTVYAGSSASASICTRAFLSLPASFISFPARLFI